MKKKNLYKNFLKHGDIQLKYCMEQQLIYSNIHDYSIACYQQASPPVVQCLPSVCCPSTQRQRTGQWRYGARCCPAVGPTLLRSPQPSHPPRSHWNSTLHSPTTHRIQQNQVLLLSVYLLKNNIIMIHNLNQKCVHRTWMPLLNVLSL